PRYRSAAHNTPLGVQFLWWPDSATCNSAKKPIARGLTRRAKQFSIGIFGVDQVPADEIPPLAVSEDFAIEIDDGDVKISIVKALCNFRVGLFWSTLRNDDHGPFHQGNCFLLGGPLAYCARRASERGNQ